MSRRKKKTHQEEHIDESWLIPYADLLTLLLALFIVLFASSSVDAQKFQAISQIFNQVFTSGSGVMDFPSPVPTSDSQSMDDQKEKNKKEQQNQEQQVDQQELKAVQEKVNTYIAKNKLTDQLDTSLSGEGLLVSIRDNVLFESGSAQVRNKDIKLAKEISALLVMDLPRSVVISGHTDNIPIKNANFSSNWELSVMRSVNFMKIILENKKLDPRLFSAKGFGEFQPVASNNTKSGRAKNRRVEILILPKNVKNND